MVLISQKCSFGLHRSSPYLVVVPMMILLLVQVDLWTTLRIRFKNNTRSKNHTFPSYKAHPWSSCISLSQWIRQAVYRRGELRLIFFDNIAVLLVERAGYLRTGDALDLRRVLGKWFPSTRKPFNRIHLFFKDWPSSSVTPLRRSKVFCDATHVVEFCISLAHCLSLLVSKESSLFRLHFQQDLHE